MLLFLRVAMSCSDMDLLFLMRHFCDRYEEKTYFMACALVGLHVPGSTSPIVHLTCFLHNLSSADVSWHWQISGFSVGLIKATIQFPILVFACLTAQATRLGLQQWP